MSVPNLDCRCVAFMQVCTPEYPVQGNVSIHQPLPKYTDMSRVSANLCKSIAPVACILVCLHGPACAHTSDRLQLRGLHAGEHCYVAQLLHLHWRACCYVAFMQVCITALPSLRPCNNTLTEDTNLFCKVLMLPVFIKHSIHLASYCRSRSRSWQTVVLLLALYWKFVHRCQAGVQKQAQARPTSLSALPETDI